MPLLTSSPVFYLFYRSFGHLFVCDKYVLLWACRLYPRVLNVLRLPPYYFRDADNLSAKILFASLDKPHLLIADAYMLPHMKRRFFPTQTRTIRDSILFHMLSTAESVIHEDANPVVE